jgi:fucose permease
MSVLLLFLAYLGFISLGLPDATLGIIWPSLRVGFELPQSAMGLVFVFGAGGYILASLSAGALMKRMGVGNLLAASTLLMVAALTGYGLALSWPFFLASAFISGLGSGAIDAGLNTYAASHFSEKHMNWLHGCYSTGATLGPMVLTAVLSAGLAWRLGYAAIALLMLLLGLAFVFTRHRWNDSAPVMAPHAPRNLRQLLGQAPPWLQIVAFWIYTGCEVVAGQWSFSLLTESRGLDVTAAGTLVSAYWACHAAGRFAFGFIVERFGAERVLRASMMLAIACAGLIAQTLSTPLTAVGLIGLGFALAPIFPCLMSLTPRRFGEANSQHLVGFQTTAAMLGVLSLPTLTGLLAERFSLEMVGVVLVTLAVALIAVHEALVFLLRRTSLSTD